MISNTKNGWQPVKEYATKSGFWLSCASTTKVCAKSKLVGVIPLFKEIISNMPGITYAELEKLLKETVENRAGVAKKLEVLMDRFDGNELKSGKELAKEGNFAAFLPIIDRFERRTGVIESGEIVWRSSKKLRSTYQKKKVLKSFENYYKDEL